MTRVLTALVLLPVVVGVVWFLPPLATVFLAAETVRWFKEREKRKRTSGSPKKTLDDAKR